MTEEQLIRAATAATLRTVAEWGMVDRDRDEMIALAIQVEVQPASEWWSCPVCQESECDHTCPLSPLRTEWATP